MRREFFLSIVEKLSTFVFSILPATATIVGHAHASRDLLNRRVIIKNSIIVKSPPLSKKKVDMATPVKKSSPAKAKAPAPQKKPTRTLSADHKDKLAQGRNESRIVSRYLEALAAGKGKRGRKRTPDSVSMQIAKIDREISSAAAIAKLELTQRRLDLVAELERLSVRVDIAEVEKAFIKVAKTYAQRTGISYGAFRTLGVPAGVLKKAGVSRARV